MFTTDENKSKFDKNVDRLSNCIFLKTTDIVSKKTIKKSIEKILMKSLIKN